MYVVGVELVSKNAEKGTRAAFSWLIAGASYTYVLGTNGRSDETLLAGAAIGDRQDRVRGK